MSIPSSLTRPRTRFDFRFDVVSPYSYLASTQLAALSASTGASCVWRPLLLRDVFTAYDVSRALLDDDTRWVRRVEERDPSDPSVLIGDELFFGNDRQWFVEQAARE